MLKKIVISFVVIIGFFATSGCGGGGSSIGTVTLSSEQVGSFAGIVNNGDSNLPEGSVSIDSEGNVFFQMLNGWDRNMYRGSVVSLSGSSITVRLEQYDDTTWLPTGESFNATGSITSDRLSLSAVTPNSKSMSINASRVTGFTPVENWTDYQSGSDNLIITEDGNFSAAYIGGLYFSCEIEGKVDLDTVPYEVKAELSTCRNRFLDGTYYGNVAFRLSGTLVFKLYNEEMDAAVGFQLYRDLRVAP